MVLHSSSNGASAFIAARLSTPAFATISSASPSGSRISAAPVTWAWKVSMSAGWMSGTHSRGPAFCVSST
jgi:hypothetical protein